MEREAGFYWVLPSLDPDTHLEDWTQKEQPAYWDGESWSLFCSDSGWSVRWVGEKIEFAALSPQVPSATTVELVSGILDGIDRLEAEKPDGGWWETTTGAEFGGRKLDEVLSVVREASTQERPHYPQSVEVSYFGGFQGRVTDVRVAPWACLGEEPERCGKDISSLLPERIADAVGNMAIFPGTSLGTRYDDDTHQEHDITLNEFMKGTYIGERWPDLLKRAAAAAAAVALALATDPHQHGGKGA